MKKDAKDPLWKELRGMHSERAAEIRSRLEDFRRVRPEQYFYELVYCLLTPQSNALHAADVQRQLEEHHFHENDFDPEPFLRQGKNYIRFHRTKSRLLLLMKAQFPEIIAVLTSGISGYDIREWFVGHVRGCGYKESTHFLRNIGKNGGLAILDRHILRNLAQFKIIRSIPHTLTRKQYLALEEKFQQFALEIGIPIDELDLLFWSQETGVMLK
jgi:N-glycosylase/DNA lyase